MLCLFFIKIEIRLFVSKQRVDSFTLLLNQSIYLVSIVRKCTNSRTLLFINTTKDYSSEL